MALTRAFKNAVHQRRSKTPIVVNGDMAVAQRAGDVTGLGDWFAAVKKVKDDNPKG